MVTLRGTGGAEGCGPWDESHGYGPSPLRGGAWDVSGFRDDIRKCA